MGLLETAAAALIGAERRNEIAARNISNAQTPGYKREVSYTEIVADMAGSPAGLPLGLAQPITRSATSGTPGVLLETGNPLDLALAGEGFMLLRDGDRFHLSRGGQFRRGAEGALEDGDGRIVQQAGGGDLVLDSDAPEILADGTVPIGAIGVYRAEDAPVTQDSRQGLSADAVAALAESGTGNLRQGMVERSNVVLSDEMVGLMRTQRMSEAGAQMVRAYDELMGQAVATFGRRSG